MADNAGLDIISVAEAGTLDGLFAERVRRTPDAVAYREYDEAEGGWRDRSWRDIERQVARWQHSLHRDGVVIPITAVAYAAFAVGIDRSIEAFRKLSAKSSIAREGA